MELGLVSLLSFDVSKHPIQFSLRTLGHRRRFDIWDETLCFAMPFHWRPIVEDN